MKKFIAVLVLMVCLFTASCELPVIDSSSQGGSGSDSIVTPGESVDPGESTNPGESVDPDDPITPDDPVGPVVPTPTPSQLNVSTVGISFESIYAQWAPADGADKYHVYCDGKLVDGQLIRNYGDYYRVDVVGLSAAEHTFKIVAVKGAQEVDSSAYTFEDTPKAHLREGFAFKNGTASGGYNDDGTLKAGARVLYVTDNNKDTITMDIQTGKSTITAMVGVQNILTGLKKGYEKDPIVIRFIGNVTDPAVLEKGDLLVDLGTDKFTGGLTLEGIGNDATFNGFGLRIKNSSNVEVRNLGFMNCDSDEGDNLGLQQDNTHIWVHNCDFFYGQAGKDADQDKGDGALDCKKSTYVTFSFNHFWDSGKSNLLGTSGELSSNYLSYHHNWYDHSDSRHPRVRTATVHVYNNYYDGNSKYGVGSTMASSIFVENNYFRNCKNPMLTSKQGTDALGAGTFSGEDGGVIKAYGNHIVGGANMIKYSANNKSYDYYDANTRDEVLPSTVVALFGGTSYNNFDTDKSIMYDYSVETALEARNTVISWAGRVQGGDFKWTFTEADDSSYAVDAKLKAALLAYTSKVILSQTVSTNTLDEEISAIPQYPTVSDIDMILGCYEKYMALSDAQKAQVKNAQLLLDHYETAQILMVERVIGLINQMDTSNDQSILAVYKEYSALSTEQKAKVTNYSVLATALEGIKVEGISHAFDNGMPTQFFKVDGNLSTSKGVATYNGSTYKKCLKMESETSISFTLAQKMTLTLVFGDEHYVSFKLNGEAYNDEGATVFTIELEVGDYVITKKNVTNLFFISVS